MLQRRGCVPEIPVSGARCEYRRSAGVTGREFTTFEEALVPTIIGHHDISKGKDHWLSSPKREELFGPLGITNIRTFVDPQNPDHVAVVMDVPDLDAFTAAMQTEAAAEAMAYDGVMPETLVILVAE